MATGLNTEDARAYHVKLYLSRFVAKTVCFREFRFVIQYFLRFV